MASTTVSVARRLSEVASMMPFHHFGSSCDIRRTGRRFYHWNSFRYLSDIMHVTSLAICLVVLLRNSRADGVSFKTHALFLVMFSARYINIFICRQFLYLIMYKVGFWLVTFAIVAIFILRGAVCTDRRDTCSVPLLVVPVVVVTLVVAQYQSVVEVLFIFSQHLEGFVMLPQYIYCYRDASRGCDLSLAYVLLLGGYRGLHGLNMMYKYFFNPSYVDISGWFSGLASLILFSDFLVFRLCGGSPLSRCALSVDDGVRDAEALARNAMAGGFLVVESHTDPKALPTSAVVGRCATDGLELQNSAASHSV